MLLTRAKSEVKLGTPEGGQVSIRFREGLPLADVVKELAGLYLATEAAEAEKDLKAFIAGRADGV